MLVYVGTMIRGLKRKNVQPDVLDLKASYAGQSLMQQQTTENAGDGDAAYKTRALTYFDTVVTSQGATGGSALLKSVKDSNYWVNDDAGLVANGNAYTTWEAAIDADFPSPNDVHIIHWNQGQTDGTINGVSKANHKAGLIVLFAAMKAKCPNATIVLDYVGVDTNELQAVAWQDIREAQIEVIDAVSYVRAGVWTVDQPLVDTVHFNSAGRILYGQRQADLAAHYLGKTVAGALGPVATAITAYQDTRNIIVTFDLDGGDTLLQDIDGTRHIGWRVKINGIESIVYAAQKSSETAFNLSIADFINEGDIVTVTWGYGPLNFPVPNQFPSSNNSDPKPLRPFFDRPVTVTDNSLSPSAIGDVDGIWDAATIVLDVSGRVEQFTDLSGNAEHIFQTDETRRPQYSPNGGHNGLPVIMSRSITEGSLKYLVSNYGAKAGMTITFVANVANNNQNGVWGFNPNRAMITGRALVPTRFDYKRRETNSNITVTNGLYTDTAKPTIITLAVTSNTEMRIYENGTLMIAGMPFDPEDDIILSNQKLLLGVSDSETDFYFGDSHARVLTQDEIMRKHAYYKNLIGTI